MTWFTCYRECDYNDFKKEERHIEGKQTDADSEAHPQEIMISLSAFTPILTESVIVYRELSIMLKSPIKLKICIAQQFLLISYNMKHKKYGINEIKTKKKEENKSWHNVVLFYKSNFKKAPARAKGNRLFDRNRDNSYMQLMLSMCIFQKKSEFSLFL